MKPLFALALAVSSASALDLKSLKPEGYVSDFARAIDAGSRARLEAYCAEIERTTSAQMAIVTLESLDGEPIEDAANTLFRQWGVGKKENNGILLLLAVRDRKQRGEVGYGLEEITPDGYIGGVLRSIRPILRQGQYGPAVLAAAQQIGGRIAQAKGAQLGDQPLARERRMGRRSAPIPWPLVLGGLFFVVWLISRIGRGGRGGGAGGGFLSGLILGNLMGRSSGWRGGGFGGYDSGGGGGGWGGFGGGDSGGGGASSDW